MFYIKEGSLVHSNLIIPIQQLAIRADSKKDDGLKKLVQELVFIYRYIKAYEPSRYGYSRQGKTYCDYTYYDEKEWRFVPDNLEPDQQLSWTTTLNDIKNANQQLQNRALKFEARDVSFIIIYEEIDINDVKDVMERSEMFKPEDQQYLLTTILTASTIRRNF